MGAFLLLATDYRVGPAGEYRIGANEVVIGITMPFFGIEICRQRLAPAHFHRAVINAEIYRPEDAVAAGFLDRVVPAGDVPAVAHPVPSHLPPLDIRVPTPTKLPARDHAPTALRPRGRRRGLRHAGVSEGAIRAAGEATDAGAARPRPAGGRDDAGQRGCGRLHHAEGRAGCRHLDSSGLRALRRQGGTRPRAL